MKKRKILEHVERIADIGCLVFGGAEICIATVYLIRFIKESKAEKAAKES